MVWSQSSLCGDILKEPKKVICNHKIKDLSPQMTAFKTDIPTEEHFFIIIPFKSCIFIGVGRFCILAYGGGGGGGWTRGAKFPAGT